MYLVYRKTDYRTPGGVVETALVIVMRVNTQQIDVKPSLPGINKLWSVRYLTAGDNGRSHSNYVTHSFSQIQFKTYKLTMVSCQFQAADRWHHPLLIRHYRGQMQAESLSAAVSRFVERNCPFKCVVILIPLASCVTIYSNMLQTCCYPNSSGIVYYNLY